MNPLASIGRTVIALFETIGRISLFAARAVLHCFKPPFYGRLLGRQLVEIGYYSLPVVGLTAIFTGMVLALQSYTQKKKTYHLKKESFLGLQVGEQQLLGQLMEKPKYCFRLKTIKL